MLEFDEYKLELEKYKGAVEELGESLDLAALRLKVEELDLKASEPDFWNDPAKSQKILQEASVYKNKLQGYEEMMGAYEDAQVMLKMAVEEDDASMEPEIRQQTRRIYPLL